MRDTGKMNVKEVLIKARARIDKPQKWISYWWCSDDGKRLGVDGAIWWASEGDKELRREAYHILAEYSTVGLWSDFERATYQRTHAEVMEMFDKAIESLT